MRRLALFLPVVAVLLTGCAIGNRYAYQSVVANPQLSGTTAVGVATHDQREYVRSGSKDPQFVGLQRGGYGNPFAGLSWPRSGSRAGTTSAGRRCPPGSATWWPARSR